MDNLATIILAIIGSSALGAFITEVFQKKNTAADALQKSAESLNLTYDQMMEAIRDASVVRKELGEMTEAWNISIRELYKMKVIARKMYEILERRKMVTGLTDAEVRMLMETKDLNK